MEDLHGIAINFAIFQNPRGGRKNDLDNLAGGVLDALVKHEILPDDNFSIVKRLYCDSTKIQHKELASITIYFVSSKYEWLYILDNFFQ
jgi:Holliday junction resolvase RusA-like endonuclease